MEREQGLEAMELNSIRQRFEDSGTVYLSLTPGGERGITEPEDVHEERPGLRVFSSRPSI